MMKARCFPETWMYTKLQDFTAQKTVNFLRSRWSVSELTLNFFLLLNRIYTRILLKLPQRKGWLV